MCRSWQYQIRMVSLWPAKHSTYKHTKGILSIYYHTILLYNYQKLTKICVFFLKFNNILGFKTLWRYPPAAQKAATKMVWRHSFSLGLFLVTLVIATDRVLVIRMTGLCSAVRHLVLGKLKKKAAVKSQSLTIVCQT